MLGHTKYDLKHLRVIIAIIFFEWDYIISTLIIRPDVILLPFHFKVFGLIIYDKQGKILFWQAET